jgi:type VI secretion system secreted protein Hcp
MAVNYFLRFDGVQGEVPTTLAGKAPIRLKSWGWRAHNLSSVAAGGGSGAGKVTLEEFTFITLFDRSSPQFFKRICAGTHVSNAILTAFKAGGSGNWLEMTFKGLLITHVQNMAASVEIPAVSVGFSFEEVKIEYKAQKSDGNLISTGPITYNRKENKLS